MKRQPTLHHLTWFLDLSKNNQLDLNPPYQRKSVWTPKDKRFFIDTIFRNYPTPPVFLHRETSDAGETTYHVVDGKQRLETILDFANGKLSVDREFGDENLNGKKFKDLIVDYKRKFWDYVLVVDFIESITGNDINEVFDRVNRNSKNLQPQELRHARFDGWFITEAETESEDRFWMSIKVSTKAKDKRMKNVQTISELLFITIENKIVGFDQDYIDSMYAKYDVLEEIEESFDLDAYNDKKTRTKEIIAGMNSLNKCVETFGKTSNNIYTLWSLLTLHENELPSVQELAERYYTFMEGAQSFGDMEDIEVYTPTTENQQQFTYFKNSKGASTDAPQRNNRLEALRTIL